MCVQIIIIATASTLTLITLQSITVVTIMAKKVKCHCGCGSQVSASTERRHRAGKATPRVKASHAARQMLYAPKHLPKTSTSKKMGLHSGCSTTPEISFHLGPSGHGHMPSPEGNPTMGGGGDDLNVESGPTSTQDMTGGISGINADDSRIFEVIANIREEVRRPHYRVTVEDCASDDEDDEDSSDDDGINWHAEISDDEKYDADGGLGVDETINEDFEQELARFGENILLYRLKTHVSFYSR